MFYSKSRLYLSKLFSFNLIYSYRWWPMWQLTAMTDSLMLSPVNVIHLIYTAQNGAYPACTLSYLVSVNSVITACSTDRFPHKRQNYQQSLFCLLTSVYRMTLIWWLWQKYIACRKIPLQLMKATIIYGCKTSDKSKKHPESGNRLQSWTACHHSKYDDTNQQYIVWSFSFFGNYNFNNTCTNADCQLLYQLVKNTSAKQTDKKLRPNYEFLGITSQ